MTVVRPSGASSAAAARVPLIGDVLVALAGAANVAFGWFSLWVVLGKGEGDRYLAVARLATRR